MRTDFQLAIITSLGFCAVLGIVPFSIYRFLSGNTFAGIVDLIFDLNRTAGTTLVLVTHDREDIADPQRVTERTTAAVSARYT